MPILRSVSPQTLLGKWSVALGGCFVLGLAITPFIAAWTGGGGETFTDNVTIASVMAVAIGAIIAAMIIGLVAAMKRNERSLLVNLVIILGILMCVFILGEFLGPQH
ncbi:MAG: hypothetical protein HY975_03090 [Candidatus Kerfeldbacteria bacterium]|nr:hypothetical protein [Candidatus Kerfeldbacteria bacterium]